MTSTLRPRRREDLLAELAKAGREHSDATVLFHAIVASLMELHPTDYKVLGMLERFGAMSAGEIARQSGLATASVTNLIDRLERKGFARRMQDDRDRRRVLVEPVLERLHGARDVLASTQRSLRRLLEGYSDGELAVIADFLTRNARRLRAEMKKLDRR